jgi:hypothetical protein
MAEEKLDELLEEIRVRPRKQDVLLLVDKPKEASSLLWSPEANPETGLVLAVGPDTYDVKPGDRVWFSHGDPGIVLDHIKDGLRFVHQSVCQGVVLEEVKSA